MERKKEERMQKQLDMITDRISAFEENSNSDLLMVKNTRPLGDLIKNNPGLLLRRVQSGDYPGMETEEEEMNEMFFTKQAEEGFQRFREDLALLRQKNREVIPERQLRVLDRNRALIPVIETLIISVCIIFGVYLVLSSTGMEAVTRITNWYTDFVKLLKTLL